MHGDDDFEDQKNKELDKRFPGARNKVNHAARSLQHQERQQEMSEDAKRAPAAFPVDFEFWLDFRFKYFQMFVDPACGHAAQFAVNQSQVGKNRQGKTYQRNTQRVKPA